MQNNNNNSNYKKMQNNKILIKYKIIAAITAIRNKEDSINFAMLADIFT